MDTVEHRIAAKVYQAIKLNHGQSRQNLEWLNANIHPYFFITMQEDIDSIISLANGLHNLVQDRRLILADRDKLLIMAVRNRPGSLYDTLRTLQEQEISYAHFAVSSAPIPDSSDHLEIQRFKFDRKTPHEIAAAVGESAPSVIRRRVVSALKQAYPGFNMKQLDKVLNILWLNNPQYVRISPPMRVARILWLYQQTRQNGGVYLDVEKTVGSGELRLLFAVGNPPQRDFLQQIMEVFNRLAVSVKRAYCLTISNEIHPYFLGTFYVTTRNGEPIEKNSELFQRLQRELYNTQILSTASTSYRELVVKGVMSGDEALLVNAFIGFCHTNLAHTHPESFDLEGIMRAFHNHPDIAQQLVRLFKARFDPAVTDRESLYKPFLEETTRIVDSYNTGHGFLDEFRRTIFRCALLLIKYTLKTNFYVLEKHALAFRIDPVYMGELDTKFTSDLPAERPFRVTYFYGRYGSGYHIGFSDIARGGWRTLITNGRDDYVTSANTLFRENYVLAHTQHLKNKDIYEGGSKMVVVLDAAGESDRELVTQRLYKLQYGLLNAFLDIFVTENGHAKDPRVIDYYGEDEPIELGPDENMHDVMVEMVAAQSVRRGYLLGIGIMSSKRVGINHKEYGVTSAGVVKFAEITMAELGTDIHREPFSVKFTGGPNGDVAGNAMRLLLERCPSVAIKLIIDGTGALYDPSGADRSALSKVVLHSDIDAFEPEALHPGGSIIYRTQTRRDGMRELFRKVVRTDSGLQELWVSNDDFYREYNSLIFTVSADLFIPAGGRPETVSKDNFGRFFADDGSALNRAIIEGANSFITPEARIELQKRGVIIMRDASANKCGVISSSYEIIANLLLSEKEFLDQKDVYVADVISILNKRAEDEARLIFRRHREAGGALLYTDISNAISTEINAHYARLFSFFQQHPQLCARPLYRNAILGHLPRLLAQEPRYRKRIKDLPPKYQYAIISSEIASSMVYRNSEADGYQELIEAHLRKMPPL
ncbi:MAG: NAD-glutamate dehydrogenase [Desulfuromonadaceae bacterium]|nr:NAD-glutamate dehydrogenase [Desulfuromonadaceae bacterium]MDD5105099.1 NAD-glutamate dehydrogenase [Desulfuromonadaceae bacterium]